MTPGTSFENCSIFDLSASRTDNRSSTSGGSTGGASGPQHAEWPISSTSVAANETPSRFQNKSENARAFSAAPGAEMISVPLAFQPSKYEQLTLSDDGAGRPRTPTRARDRVPPARGGSRPKSATTSGVM